MAPSLKLARGKAGENAEKALNGQDAVRPFRRYGTCSLPHRPPRSPGTAARCVDCALLCEKGIMGVPRFARDLMQKVLCPARQSRRAPFCSGGSTKNSRGPFR